ncbi:MAG TPA: 50S ribosomal protein L17 [Candidatus Paceibacterota bacterium]|nr:50S ribosomal protein L17 [Candidatus Paceibacterota bacterium]
MRHHHKGRTFGRTHDQRVALMRGLMRSLIIHERISTTEAKAKELRPAIEKLVSHARKDTVANRRLVASRLDDDEATAKLFTAIAPRYAERPGGYTRIVKRAATATDGRKQAYIAFV